MSKNIFLLEVKETEICILFFSVSLIIIFFSCSLTVFIVSYYNPNYIASSTSEKTTANTHYTPSVILKKFQSTINEDVRIPLWEGTLNLIQDYPYIGTGAARFESIFASYRPLDYFMKPNNAVRSNHPHNTLLYIAAAFGIPALILWCILWLYPMVYCFITYFKLSTFQADCAICILLPFLPWSR